MEISDWQTSCKVIKERGDHLLKQKHWADCSFLVGSDENASIVWAHKLILAMASPVFEAMFYGKMAETSYNIRINDINQDIFEIMLEYIYADKFYIKSIEDAFELSYCAKKYMLPHLLNSCTKVIYSQLSTENACRAYEFGILYDNKSLVKKSLQIIIDNTTKVLSMANFSDIAVSTIITIFDQPTLNIDNELVLLEAAAKYAEVHNIVLNGETKPESIDHRLKVLSINESTSTSYQSTSSTSAIVNSSPSLREAVQKIRFLTLTPSLFAGNEASKSLLTNTEISSILMNISFPSCGVPMPEGFSTFTERRKKHDSDFTEEGNNTTDSDSLEPIMYLCLQSNFPCAIRDTAPDNRILCDLIVGEASLGRLVEAESLCKQMRIRKGETSDVATMHNHLALVYKQQKNYAKAIELLSVALSIWEKTLGVDNRTVAFTFNNMAFLYGKSGKYREAEPLCKRALSISEKLLGSQNGALWGILNNLGVISEKLGKYDEAEYYYQRALERYKLFKSDSNDPDVIRTKNSLVNLYLKQAKIQGSKESLYE